MNPRDYWTPERITRLKELWLEGLPARRIGNLMGCSKNTIIGKARRLGLPRRESPIKRKPGAPLPKPKRRAKPLLKVVATRRVPPPREPQFFTSCQWIDGKPTPDDSCKCGAPVLIGAPYCAAHWTKAWRPMTKEEKDVAAA